jgi:hypothetical protein
MATMQNRHQGRAEVGALSVTEHNGILELYGDSTKTTNDAGDDRARRDSGTEEVIRLGGARWR